MTDTSPTQIPRPRFRAIPPAPKWGQPAALVLEFGKTPIVAEVSGRNCFEAACKLAAEMNDS